MSNYNRTVWQDSPETEITAERLNNMEEGIKTANDGLYRPNLFINGNFQIWSNGEVFQVQNKDTEVVTPVITADKWHVESIDSTEVLNVNKVNDGLYISSSTPQECAIYQLLDDETYNAIKYQTLTLSYEYTRPYSAEDTSIHYETHKEVKKIVAEETLAWEFVNNNAIRLPVGTVGGAGCTLHWVKLEVGELDTPCIPDSKDALICKLENEVTELNGKLFKVVDVITYTDSFSPNTGRPHSQFLSANVSKLSVDAFAIIEHNVNSDWFVVTLVYLDRNNPGVQIQYYNYYNDTLTGTIKIKIYDIVK